MQTGLACNYTWPRRKSKRLGEMPGRHIHASGDERSQQSLWRSLLKTHLPRPLPSAECQQQWRLLEPAALPIGVLSSIDCQTDTVPLHVRRPTTHSVSPLATPPIGCNPCSFGGSRILCSRLDVAGAWTKARFGVQMRFLTSYPVQAAGQVDLARAVRKLDEATPIGHVTVNKLRTIRLPVDDIRRRPAYSYPVERRRSLFRCERSSQSARYCYRCSSRLRGKLIDCSFWIRPCQPPAPQDTSYG